MSEWKPGDVAMVRSVNYPREIPDQVRMLDGLGRWQGAGGYLVTDDAIPLHRVVVIDAEDFVQVGRLADCYITVLDHGAVASVYPSINYAVGKRLAAALREFAAPSPPKPEEPMLLGAVVLDDRQHIWTRWSCGAQMGKKPWRSDGVRPADWAWSEFNAVRILSEGVPA